MAITVHRKSTMPALSHPTDVPRTLHTILGANGVIARELSGALGARGLPLRQVSRQPRAVHATDERVVADLLDAAAVSRAVAGSAVVYLVAGLAYDTAVWQNQWPLVMRNVIEACQRHSARLVFFDNVYAYGWVKGAMTETTPFNPCSKKGEVRAKVASALLDAISRREVTAMIARSADFYGPGAANSLLGFTVFNRLQAGKAPQWIGDPTTVHDFTYTPDAGRALAALALTEAAYGQTWHLPTAQEELTGALWARLACEKAGQPDRLQVMPNWLLTPLAWVVPALRENREMMYQLQHGYRFDSGKIQAALGLTATACADGIAATLKA